MVSRNENLSSLPSEFFTPDMVTSLDDVQSHISRYGFAADFIQNKAVLDCACGMGYGSHYLKKKGARIVVGGDISKEAINYANGLYKERGLFFIQLDAASLPFSDNCFDVIVSFETIEHLENYRNFLLECARVLKGAGVFICSTPNRYRDILSRQGLNPFHIHEFSPKELHNLAREFFPEVKLYYQQVRLKKRILSLGATWLTLIPGGSHLKPFIKKVIPRETTYTVGEICISEEELDRKYEVRPAKGLSSLFPRSIVIVAKKQEI